MHGFQPGQRRIYGIQPPQDAIGDAEIRGLGQGDIEISLMAMAGQAIRVLIRGLNFSSSGVSVENLPRKRLPLPLPSATPSVRSSRNGLLVLVDWLMSLLASWRCTQWVSREETSRIGLSGCSRLSRLPGGGILAAGQPQSQDEQARKEKVHDQSSSDILK